MHPQLGIRETGIIKEVILVAVAVDDDLDPAVTIKGQQLFLIAGRVDDGADVIINEDRIALGILAAADQAKAAFFKIEIHEKRSLSPLSSRSSLRKAYWFLLCALSRPLW
jgi:hypothetical protein